jgi:hypothetical protein
MIASTLLLGLFGCSEYDFHAQPPDVEPPLTSSTIVDAFIPVAVVDQGLNTKRNAVVQLDGTASFDPDDAEAVLSVTWEVTDSATKKFVFTDTDTLTPSFSADTLGLYTFKLTVEDMDGNISENLAMTAVEVVQWENLELEVIWTKEVDIDLHLVAPKGAYYESTDCYYGNPEPDWGISGSLTDNPVLVDDGEGASSERITLYQPSVGTYQVYAHYFNDYDIEGQTNVQLAMKLWAEGEVVAEYSNVPLMVEGQVALFGELDWDTLMWTERLTNFTHEELGGPDTNERR